VSVQGIYGVRSGSRRSSDPWRLHGGGASCARLAYGMEKRHRQAGNTSGGRDSCDGVRTGFGDHREKSQPTSRQTIMMLHFVGISSLEALSMCYPTCRL